MTVRVLATAAQGPSSPGFRVRTQLPAEALAEHGVHVSCNPLFDAQQELAYARARQLQRLSIVLHARRRLARELRAVCAERSLIQRQVDVLPLLTLERHAARGRSLILDVDDAIWLDATPDA